MIPKDEKNTVKQFSEIHRPMIKKRQIRHIIILTNLLIYFEIFFFQYDNTPHSHFLKQMCFLNESILGENIHGGLYHPIGQKYASNIIIINL